VQIIHMDPIMDSRATDHADGGERNLVLALDDFARKAIEEESAKLGVSVQELATFAVLYYLADLDSGRISRRLPAGEETQTTHSEQHRTRR
jgi:hypothetical protein